MNHGWRVLVVASILAVLTVYSLPGRPVPQREQTSSWIELGLTNIGMNKLRGQHGAMLSPPRAPAQVTHEGRGRTIDDLADLKLLASFFGMRKSQKLETRLVM